MSHIEVSWEYPAAASFYERMAAFSRLVLFDRRGTGLLDPIVGDFTIEERKDDIRAVSNEAQDRRSRPITAPARGYPLVLLAVSLTVAAYTMRVSSNTLYVNALPATQV